jgi:hypothetical protein
MGFSVTDYIYILYIPTLQAKKVSVSQPICVVNMNITHNMPPVLQVCPKPKKRVFSLQKYTGTILQLEKKKREMKLIERRGKRTGRNC